MSSELLSSKTVIYEGKPNLRGIQPAATSVAGAIGITERGPIGKPTLVTSQEEFQNIFGGFTANSDLALAVKGFFENGGSQLWVVRTVHYTNVSNPNTATASSAYGYIKANGVFVPAMVVGSDAPFFSLNSGDKIAISVDGEEETEAIFQAQPAQAESQNAETFSLSDGDTLTVKFEDGREQTITFSAHQFQDISAATDVEIAAVINEQLTGGKAVRTEVSQ